MSNYNDDATQGGWSMNGTEWNAMSSEIDEKVSSDNTTDGVTGSDQITNIVSCTQAEYDAGTPNSTTIYIITD